jgi:methyl-accepting chemotaxis protein
VKLSVRVGILPKVFVTLIVVTVIPLAAIWYLDYRATMARLSTDIDDRLSRVAAHGVTFVNAWVDTHVRLLTQNATLDDITSMDARRQKPILESIARVYPWIFLAHTVAPDGVNLARNDHETPKDYSDRKWFLQPAAGMAVGRQVVISRTTGQPAFSLAVPIRDAKGGVTGVLSIVMHIDELTKRIANVRIGATGFAFLVDETGAVIAHPKARGKLADHPAVVALPLDTQKKVVFNEDGKTVVAYVQKTDLGWTLVAQQDYAEAYAPIVTANRNALILLVASIIFVGLLASALAPRLTRPIRHLTEIADTISRGQLAAEIREIDRSDEIGGLARAIDRLKTSVEVAMRRLTANQRTAPAVDRGRADLTIRRS